MRRTRHGSGARAEASGQILALGALLMVACCGDSSGSSPEAVRPAPAGHADRAMVRRFWTVYRDGLAAKEEGRWDDAARLFTDALQIEPEHQTALYFLGTSQFERGRYAEAGQVWERLVEAHPENAAGHFQLANLHACPEAGAPWNLDLAELELEKVLRLNREQTGPMSRLAEIALARGDLQRATRLFEDVTRTNPVDGGSFYLLGYIVYLGGDLDGAARRLGQAAVALRGQSPVRGILGEGDSTARLRTTFPEKRLFAGLWLGLEKRAYGESPTTDQARAEYEEARRYHQALAARLPGVRLGSMDGDVPAPK